MCHESEILFSSGMEHLRFHYCGIVTGRIGSGGRSRSIRITIVSFGKILLYFTFIEFVFFVIFNRSFASDKTLKKISIRISC